MLWYPIYMIVENSSLIMPTGYKDRRAPAAKVAAVMQPFTVSTVATCC